MKQRKKDFSTSVADEVEKSVKEKSAKAENFVRKALDSFEELIYQLVAIRPKEYRPRDFTPTRDFTPNRDFTPTRDFTPRDLKKRESRDNNK